jgi:hypothetical protein
MIFVNFEFHGSGLLRGEKHSSAKHPYCRPGGLDGEEGKTVTSPRWNFSMLKKVFTQKTQRKVEVGPHLFSNVHNFQGAME